MQWIYFSINILGVPGFKCRRLVVVVVVDTFI